MTTLRSIGALVLALALLMDPREISAGDRKESLFAGSQRLADAVDNIVTNRMQKSHVPGAVVTIVKGNKIVFNKGYGFANLEERRQVDAEHVVPSCVGFQSVQRHGGIDAGGPGAHRR